MATHSVFGNNPVEIPANGLMVTYDQGATYRIGTLFYTSGAGTETDGWRCKGARIYIAADSGADTMPASVTLSLWVQSTIDVTTLGTSPLRTGTVNTSGRPGWFEVAWDSVEIIGGQKFMVSYEGDNKYQYVPGSNAIPYDDSVQASDGSSLFMSEDGGSSERGYYYDINTGTASIFPFYTGLDVLVDDDSEAPTSPTDLSAIVDGQKVALGWTAATDNVAVTGYRIYRGTTPGFTAGAVTRVAQVGSLTSFTDILFTSGTYYYKISAIDGARNESSVSNEEVCSVTVSGAGVYLYPSDLGWTTGATQTDLTPGGQTLGTLFSVTQPSPIAGLRFYSPVNSMNNTVKLWADGVEVLASYGVNFINGWNVCLFDVPYESVPGVTYCVSVYLSGATQSYTGHSAQFSTVRTTVGTVYSEIVENGVYGEGDSYPSSDFQATWYGVDAIVLAPPARTGDMQVWDGGAWQPHPLKVWDGSAWVKRSASGYDGTDFIVGK